MNWRQILFVKNNYKLLLDELNGLYKTPYFNQNIHDFLKDIIIVVEHILANYNSIPNAAKDYIYKLIWQTSKYLSGTSINKVPYEIVCCLDKALYEWDKTPRLITTALIDDPDFHFFYIQPGVIFSHILPTAKKIDKEIIQIALPRLYRHKPLYITALYHELGHFIDQLLKITDWSLIIHPVGLAFQETEKAHRAEFFADLFAACYTGKAYLEFLRKFASSHGASKTHPATSDRISNINDFLSSADNIQISRINKILGQLSRPALEVKYIKPDITESFNNLRPFIISNDKELHGIFEAGWDFLEKAHATPNKFWIPFNEFEKDKVVNDLIEKSIRNKMIREKWNGAAN